MQTAGSSKRFLRRGGRFNRPALGLTFLLATFFLATLQVTAVSQTDDAPPNLAPLEALANNWLKRPELQHSLIGLEVLHIPSGHVLFSHNGRKRFVPASVTKVFTTACAMDNFGADYKYRTKLKAYGSVSGNRLNGNLLIEPSQDPTLKTAELRELLASVGAKGIKTVEGRLDTASIPGGGDRFVTSWLAEDYGQDWMPPSSDLVLDDNLARRDPARGYPLITMTAGPETNTLVSSLLRSPFGPSWVCFNPAKQVMEFWHPDGPLTGGQLVGNPEQYNTAAARTLARTAGIKMNGKDIHSVMTDVPTVLGEHASRPLSEIIKKCLKESDNLYAQQLLRTIGTQPPVNKAVEKATLEERGLARLHSWLSSIGVSSSEVVLWDGCGLSRKNCFSPHALNLVHKHMAGENLRSAYLDVMPFDGAAGATTGTFRYKTGAMDSVRCISGIVITAAGEPLAVTVMINAHSPSVRELRMSIGSLIDHLQGLGSLRFAPEPSVPRAQPKAQKSTSQRKQSTPPARKTRSRRTRH
ncbi:MAG: D-alanyl-D-alanine carboxypeptidase [Candidatus Obscuribacterales bacterium]|nr:D-alanyl-D-alanine carboxypeptidase [Candidatus Obscuribacterales bacterium]